MTQPVAVIGAGVIGIGWAAHFAAEGRPVRLYDPEAARLQPARTAVLEGVRTLRALRPDGPTPAQAAARLSLHDDLAEACADAVFVQENAPERETVKRELFVALDRCVPAEAIVATSTSGLALTPLQEGLARPERFVIGHPFNPVHLIPLVEVAAGAHTAPETVARTLALYEAGGKAPIRLNKEAPGHLGNRLQAALWREAVAVVEDGLASVEDVDKALVHGLGLRWAVCGPHMTFHLGGGAGGLRGFIEHLGPGIERRWRTFRTPSLTPELVDRLVAGVEAEAGGADPEALAAERDAALLRLLRARYDSGESGAGA